MRGLVRRWALGMFAITAVGGRAVSAADLGPAERYMAADVIAVGAIDLTKVDVPAMVGEAESWGLVPQQQLADARRRAEETQSHFSELAKLGARQAVVLLRTSDLSAGGPSWIIVVDGDPQRVVEWLTPRIADAKAQRWGGDFSKALPQHFEIVDGMILGAATPQRLAALKASAGGDVREDARPALDVLANADAGIVAIGDADGRRVLREMFPALPAPFAEINGPLLADGVQWAGLAVKLPPQATMAVVVEAAEPTTAATLEQATAKGLELLKGLCMVEMINGPPDHKARATALLPLVPLLKPTVAGTRLSLTLGDDAAELDAVRALLGPAVMASREAAHRASRMNNFKQIALGMHNYASKYKSFPAAATYDASGKPLLSWRVHILPFIDQQALYNEFRLDEPWDSEHNRKLIARMPDLYEDPDPAVQRAIGAGRTTTLVPAGEGTAFDRREGTKFSEITDGSAMTILLVDGLPERAVEWTKPEDWSVDFNNPLAWIQAGEGAKQRDRVTVAMCDGSVRAIDGAIDAKALASQLTRSADDALSRLATVNAAVALRDFDVDP